MSLYVKPISAILTRDTETFSNMDPYVIIEIGGTKQKTKVHKQGGKKPKWDQVFTFHPKGNKMVVTVMDKDTFSDDKIGTGAVDLEKYMKDPIEHKEYISLTHGSKSAGKVYMSIRYQGPANQGPNQNSNWGNQVPNNISGQQGQNWGQGQQGQNWGQGQQAQSWGQGQQGQQAQSWGQGQNQVQPQSSWGNQPNQFVNPGQNNNMSQGWGQQGQQSSWGNPNQPPGGFNNSQNSSWGQNSNQPGNSQIPINVAGQLAGNLMNPQGSNWGNQGQPPQPQSQWGENNNGWNNSSNQNQSSWGNSAPNQNQSSWGNQNKNNNGW